MALLSACSGDDAPATSASTAPTATETEGPPPTSTPPECADLADEYLDRFFALGAGTPEDDETRTVRLPVQDLRAIVADAEAAGCAEFREVPCSAYAELEAQGLEATNGEPPNNC